MLIRGTFDGLVGGLTADPSVQALGLFGSWVRGEVFSDFDVLVVDGSGLGYEYSEVDVRGGVGHGSESCSLGLGGGAGESSDGL